MVEYDPRKFVAHWLLERLTIENTFSKNQAKRLNISWNPDPKVPKMFHPIEQDYNIAKVGYILYIYFEKNNKLNRRLN